MANGVGDAVHASCRDRARVWRNGSCRWEIENDGAYYASGGMTVNETDGDGHHDLKTLSSRLVGWPRQYIPERHSSSPRAIGHKAVGGLFYRELQTTPDSSMSSQEQNTPVRRHSKKNSADMRAQGAPRRMTAGPLDLDFELPPPPSDDKLPQDISASSSTAMTGGTFATAPERVSSPASATGSINTIGGVTAAEPLRDYAYLLDPLIFRHLPNVERNQLSLVPLAAHLHNLASQAATNLNNVTASDSFHIFNLWYIRLTSLSLISAQTTAMSSQEIKVFGDLTSNFYRSPNFSHAVPWDLRVLAIRLQALGFNDWRRCLEHFYMLAKEARSEAIKHRNSPALFKLWRGRLLDVGLRVAAALLEISDVDGAERHLKTIMEDKDELDSGMGFRLREAVLYLQLGQLDTAKNCYLANGAADGEDADAVIEGLRLMVTDDFEGAALLWKKLVDKEEGEGEKRTTYLVNMAVSLLYLRRLPEAQSNSNFKLQSTMDRQLAYSYKSLTFNIVTLHNLLDTHYEPMVLDIKQQLELLNEEMTGILRKREQKEKEKAQA
ncbi:hypothetical protein H072_9537 [Dactylellina haptotyla CBS 200.50]|uniref:Uncharacterized protein n=1 Tax=Dactylellina haptotyla (strain CBS 200.50) TaxID=1284197 RepID=S8A6Y9_DACHA|nr:hypothetical protein H072_9537 [Dactylellina haptotyla CBS 200.50]